MCGWGKINPSTLTKLGQIDVFGFENKPTASDLKKRNECDFLTIALAFDNFLGTRSNLQANHIRNVLQILSHREKKRLRKETWKTAGYCRQWMAQVQVFIHSTHITELTLFLLIFVHIRHYFYWSDKQITSLYYIHI